MLSYSKVQAFVFWLKWMLFLFAGGIVGGILVVVVIAVGALMQGEKLTAESLLGIGGNPWSAVFGNGLVWVALMVWEIKRLRLSRAKALAMRASPLSRFAPVAVIGLGVVVIGNDIEAGVEALLPMPEFFRNLMNSLGDMSAYPIGALLAMVVIAPVTEEAVFRGFILRGLLNQGAGARTAVLLSAFLFAVMHLNPWQGVAAFFIGLVLGWVYLRTRSLALCMTLHAINNGFSVLMSNWPGLGKFLGMTDPNAAEFTPWWLSVAGVVLLAGGMAWLRFLTLAGAPADELAPAKPPPLPVMACQGAAQK